MRRVILNSFVVVIIVLLMVAVLDVGYRIWRYTSAVNAYAPYNFWWVDEPVYLFDADVGYHYPPNTRVRHTYTEHTDFGLHAVDVVFNNVGHISGENDFIDKAAGEYRIALIGDSFTAGIFSPQPYGDILQAMLNQQPDLLARLPDDVNRVNVINFGMDAIGLEQFAAVYDHRVRPYNPDLIVISFISDDIRRRFLWRDVVTMAREGRTWDLHLTCYGLPVALDNPLCHYSTLILPQQFVSEKTGLDPMRRDLYFSDIDRRPWTHIYPELLATLGGYRLGLLPRLEPGEHPAMRLYQNDAYSQHVSQGALAHIVAQHANTLIVHLPVHVELLAGAIDPLAIDFMQANAGLPFVTTHEMFLQTSRDEQTIRSWYNLPFDGHFSQAGATLYADILMRMIGTHIATIQQ